MDRFGIITCRGRLRLLACEVMLRTIPATAQAPYGSEGPMGLPKG